MGPANGQGTLSNSVSTQQYKQRARAFPLKLQLEEGVECLLHNAQPAHTVRLKKSGKKNSHITTCLVPAHTALVDDNYKNKPAQVPGDSYPCPTTHTNSHTCPPPPLVILRALHPSHYMPPPLALIQLSSLNKTKRVVPVVSPQRWTQGNWWCRRRWTLPPISAPPPPPPPQYARLPPPAFGVHPYCRTCLSKTGNVVLFHLSDGREAVGGARGVGHHVHVWRVFLLVDAHYEHRCISRRSADHNLPRVQLSKYSARSKLISQDDVRFTR